MKRLRLAVLITLGLIVLTAGRYQPRATPSAAAGGGGMGGTKITYPWRFGYLTDIHCRWLFGGGASGLTERNDYQLGKVVDTLNTLGAEVMVIGGDWAEDVFIQNNSSNADSFTSKITRFRGTVIPCMGNHEANGVDTLAQRDPYYTSQQRFPALFQGKNWYKYDYKNVRFIALQNSANYNLTNYDDYLVNNPTSYAYRANCLQGYDWDGITNSASAQRTDMALWTKRTSVGSRWVIPIFHRAIYGSNVGNATRLNFGRGTRGYMKALEDSLPTGRRGLALFGDQHILYMLTNPMKDSTVVSGTTKGFHHLIVASGSGSRYADSTSVPSGTYRASLYRNGSSAPYSHRASSTLGTCIDTLSTVGDPAISVTYTWSLITVYADEMMIETFAVWQPASASCDCYTGAGSHILIDRKYIYRDVD